MFSALGSSRQTYVRLAVVVLLILIFLAVVGSAESPWPVIRMLGFLFTAFLLALYLALGFSAYWAPWRILWRQVPALNTLVFPDLNGIWYGMTQSNWPVVSQLREAALGEGAVDPAALSKIELVSGEIAIEIKSSLFGMAVRSSVATGAGDPTTVMVRAQKNFETGNYELFYVYRQTTSDARAAEESSHLGATMLVIRPGLKPDAEGFYRTRRNWREGMSTAGTISAQRVTDRHAPTGANLLDFTRECAVETLA